MCKTRILRTILEDQTFYCHLSLNSFSAHNHSLYGILWSQFFISTVTRLLRLIGWDRRNLPKYLPLLLISNRPKKTIRKFIYWQYIGDYVVFAKAAALHHVLGNILNYWHPSWSSTLHARVENSDKKRYFLLPTSRYRIVWLVGEKRVGKGVRSLFCRPFYKLRIRQFVVSGKCEIEFVEI